MNIDILQEVTDWTGHQSLNKANGVYWVQKKTGYLVAFQAPGKEKKVFKNPLKKFSKARRKFKKIGEE